MSDKSVEEWIQEVLESGIYKNVGGFSLMCRIFEKDQDRGYAVVTNRSSVESAPDYIIEKEDEVLGYGCEGLSNSLLHDEWPKVKMGKKLLQMLKGEENLDQERLIQQCFDLLSYEPLKITYLM